MSLGAEVWASRLELGALSLGFGPQCWNLELEVGGGHEEGEGGEEKFPLCESIGHRPKKGKNDQNLRILDNFLSSLPMKCLVICSANLI